MKALDNRDRTMIAALEKVFGIKEAERYDAAWTEEKYTLRRSPGLMSYGVYNDKLRLIGYLIIGENEDGRIDLRAETPLGMKVFPAAGDFGQSERVVYFALGALYAADTQNTGQTVKS
ncbi:hypothetical protein AB0G15_05780 [Streptosporangium sp. NPDC023825]|uniref:hypothetical protein n=1 Tax=Streptosporangium sp. NPDC023825 TaxID=3154909 RepID=UPI00341DD500